MICFFLTAFSIPFWIPTTYKAYLSEYEPYAKMFTEIKSDAGDAAYMTTLNNFVEIQKDKFDYLVKLDAPGFFYEDKNFDDARGIDLIKVNYGDYEFTYNFEASVKIYASVQIIAYAAVLTLLVVFVLYMNNDVSKFVIFPLEQMFEKVSALS